MTKFNQADPSHSDTPDRFFRWWCIYIIRTERGTLYTGISNDFKRRWRDHTSSKKGAKYFRTSRPAKLELMELATDRSSASRREYAIKQLTRKQKEHLIRCQGPYPVCMNSDTK